MERGPGRQEQVLEEQPLGLQESGHSQKWPCTEKVEKSALMSRGLLGAKSRVNVGTRTKTRTVSDAS